MRTRQFLTFGFDLLLPPCCSVCRARLDTPGLCAACWAELQPITDPLRAACGRPLPYAMPTDLCGDLPCAAASSEAVAGAVPV